MNRMERFSEAARRILSRASEHASDLKDGSIRLPHVLLAMLENDVNGLVHRALAAGNLKFDTTYDLVAKLPPLTPEQRHPELSTQVKRMIEEAVNLSRKSGTANIDDLHLLRGMFAVQDKFLFDMLTGLGTQPEVILDHLNRLTSEVGDFPTEADTPPPPPAPAGVVNPPNTPAGEPAPERSEGISNIEDRLLKLEIQATAPIEPGDWVVRFPLQTLLEQYTHGEEGKIRLVMENFSITITFE